MMSATRKLVTGFVWLCADALVAITIVSWKLLKMIALRDPSEVVVGVGPGSRTSKTPANPAKVSNREKDRPPRRKKSARTSVLKIRTRWQI
jgi:hypothetical protein